PPQLIPLSPETRVEEQPAAGVPPTPVPLVRTDRGPLPTEQRVAGQLNRPEEVDVWRFEGRAGQYARLAFERDQSLALRVDDLDGNPLALGLCSPFILTLPREGGYFVLVGRRGDAPPSEPVSYQLTLTLADTPPEAAAAALPLQVEVDRGVGGSYRLGE